MGLMLKEALKSLCCTNEWCYGVFWRFDERNTMLLTVEDAYYEEQMGAVVRNMSQKVHVLGEGVVGQAAFTGKHLWIFSDDDGSIGNQALYQDDSTIHQQFSSGVKTISVICVESRGVIQLGSTKKIVEEQEFVDQTKNLFSTTEHISGLTSKDNTCSSLNYESYDLNEWFDSLCNGNITPIDSGNHSDLMDIAYTPQSSQPFSFPLDVQQERVSTLHVDSSHPINHLQTASTEAQMLLSGNHDTQLQQLSSQFASSLARSATKIPAISTWSNEGSILTSLKSQIQHDMGVQDSQNIFSSKANTPLSCRDMNQIFQGDSISSLPAKEVVKNQHSALLIHAAKGGLPGRELGRSSEEFKSDDFTTDLSNSHVVDDIFEWFSPSPQLRISGMATVLNNSTPQLKVVASVSSSLIGDLVVDVPYEQPANSVQSSITDGYVCGGNQNSVTVNGSEKDLFEGLAVTFGCRQTGSCWEDMVTPVVSNGDKSISSGVAECVSELDGGSAVASRKGLFSELGLEELFDGISKSSIHDELSHTKRRRVESASVNSNQVQLANLGYSGGCTRMEPGYNLDKSNNLLPKTEVFQKSQVSLWIDDSYSVNNGNATMAKPKKSELPAKTTRKRARPGESTRPRPKDRQKMQDCLRELKEIIPDGGKCSIDALLDRTIKHMFFLQSVTKYADKIKQADEPKLIGQENRIIQKDNSTSCGGKTWALEVAEETMVCPIIVEDLSPSGLMLIEILCEDRGFFLEIADVIKGFGLNILKGVMEIRKEKLWARFIVEAKMHITRIEVFWSLVQLLERTVTTGMDSPNQPHNATSGGVPLVRNSQLPALTCPISLADTVQ